LALLSLRPGSQLSAQSGFMMSTKTRTYGTSPWQWHTNILSRPENITAIMGYITDLTIVMNGLFTKDVPKAGVKEVLDEYTTSRKPQMHGDIWLFISDKSNFRFVTNKDLVLDEIVRLINANCNCSE
jgi:hypothetical protein